MPASSAVRLRRRLRLLRGRSGRGSAGTCRSGSTGSGIRDRPAGPGPARPRGRRSGRAGGRRGRQLQGGQVHAGVLTVGRGVCGLEVGRRRGRRHDREAGWGRRRALQVVWATIPGLFGPEFGSGRSGSGRTGLRRGRPGRRTATGVGRRRRRGRGRGRRRGRCRGPLRSGRRGPLALPGLEHVEVAGPLDRHDAGGGRATAAPARGPRRRGRRGARGGGRGRRGRRTATGPAARSRTCRAATAGRGSSRRPPRRRPGWPSRGRTPARSRRPAQARARARAAARRRARRTRGRSLGPRVVSRIGCGPPHRTRTGGRRGPPGPPPRPPMVSAATGRAG